MASRKPPRKHVGSAFETSIQAGIKRRKNPPKFVYKYKPVEQRQFYHCQSLTIAENADSTDSEKDFQRLDIQRHRKIIDINHQLSNKQKSIMNLWNEFVGSRNQFGIKQMEDACIRFINDHIEDIRKQKLHDALVLHLCTLFNGNLLMQRDLWSVIEHLHMHMGVQQKYSTPVSSLKIQQSNGKESRKRKRSSSSSADGFEPKQKQQRYRLRAVNGIVDR